MNPIRAIANLWNGLSRMAASSVDLSPTSDFWYTDVGLSSHVSAGVTVTESTALTYSAVWAATRLLSGTIGSLPLNLYRRTGERGKAVARDDSRNALVQYRPNPEMKAMMFRSQAAIQQINAGNCYSEIERDRSGRPIALNPIHHTRCRAVRDEDTEELLYEVRLNYGEPVYLDAADVLHVPSMMSDDGITGKGVIRHARESIGFGIATEKYGSKWFGSGGVPRAVVTTQRKLTPDARDNFRKEWKKIYGGPEGDRVALLTEGADIKALNVTPEDSQFLGSRQHNVEEIARWYGVPPHKIQHLLRSTFNNIEHQSIEWVVDGLMPWLILWEQELDAKLLADDEQESMYFKFNVMGLLRGDAQARTAIYHSMLTDGWGSHNEVREIEDFNPVEGGDVRYIQGAMIPIGENGLPIVLSNSIANTDGEDSGPPETTSAAAATGDVQATALNGAQIVALIDIAERLATEQLPPDGTRALIEAAFPLMKKNLIDTIVKELDKFTPKPQEPAPAPFPPADTPVETEPTDEARVRTGIENACIAAARVMLSGAVKRMMRYEAREARQAAKRPEKFLMWLESFYDDNHCKTFTEAIAPPCDALISLGFAADAGTLAAAQVKQSKDVLLELSGNCTATELAHKVDATVTEWESRRPNILLDYYEGKFDCK